MFAVTYHDLDGTVSHAAKPRYGWGFAYESEAKSFVKNFILRCRKLNPTAEDDGQFRLTITELPNVAIEPGSDSHDALFDAWLAAENPWWLKLTEAEIYGHGGEYYTPEEEAL